MSTETLIHQQTIDLGRVQFDDGSYYVEVDVELTEQDGKLRASFSGSIGNWTAGQIQDEIQSNIDNFPDQKRVKRILELWTLYHLNDMHAGTPAQEAIIRAYSADWEKAKQQGVNSYDWACALLQRFKMLTVGDYTYGHGWLYEPIPAEVIEEIKRGL